MTDDNGTVRADGWIAVDLDAETTVFVRVGEADDGTVIVTDLLLSGQEITTDTLRSVQIGRILATAERSLTITVTNDDGSIETYQGGTDAVGLLRVVAHKRDDDSEVTLGELRGAAPLRHRKRRRRKLGRPDGTDPDAFYARVAEAYIGALSETGHPAIRLAEENDIPVETVRRWIKEARRRGALPPGRKGRAG